MDGFEIGARPRGEHEPKARGKVLSLEVGEVTDLCGATEQGAIGQLRIDFHEA